MQASREGDKAMEAPGGAPCSPDGLRRMVLAHRPADRRETRSCARLLEELDRLDRPCDRGADPVHVTASGIIAGSRGTVLHLHRRLHRWLQPGGHIDPGEGPSEAALRECREETGLAISHAAASRPLHIDVHPAAEGHTHLDLRYLMVAGDEDPEPPPGESQEVRWFAWSEAEGLADEGLRTALAGARHRLGGTR